MAKKKKSKAADSPVPTLPTPVADSLPEPIPSKAPPPTDQPREDFWDSGIPEEEEVFQHGLISRSRSRSRSPSPGLQKQPLAAARPRASANGISSPALSALGDKHEEDSNFDTRAWARDIPFGLSPPAPGFSPRGSPANHTPSTAALGTSPSAPPFSLAGSPPTGGDPQRFTPGHDTKTGFGGASPAMSPRNVHRPPARHSMDAHSLSVSPRGRPMSMQYPVSTQRPQAHFRGRADVDVGMMPSRSASGRRDGSPLVLFDQAYYEGHVGDVVVSCSGSSLHVFRLDREKLTILGALNGLRGNILSAKMLPPGGEKAFAPMVVLIVHGPMVTSENLEDGDRDLDAPSFRPAVSSVDAQTTVEVYDLAASRHVATLYRSPPVNVGPRASLTDPTSAVGALAIHVGGPFVTVTSGQSGEVYIFKCINKSEKCSFICLGKTWTSMPPARTRSYSVSSTSSVSTSSHDDLGVQSAPEVGIVSLSHRWLAVIPPPASSQTSLQGEAGVPGKSTREPPGLLSHTSPAQPSSNCEADTPLDEGFINKMARDAAQEAMKGARRAGEAGFQAFKNYWNKNDATTAAEANAYNQYGAQASSFPPTHAQDNLYRPTQSATMISVIDLENFHESNDSRAGMLVQPVATFPIRHGCSFLSFGPTGLSLFTSSAKGDVSYVWCLMRMIHGVVATPRGDVSQSDNHASVRQVARYSRLTTSNIVDVVWTKPKGEKLAILTEKGTVHIHDLPASAFRWPPPQHRSSPASSPRPGSEASSQQTAKSHFSSALSFVQGTAQSFSAAKLRSSLAGASFKDLAATAGVKGGRMVAAGISKSVGAASGTMSNIRHMGENRIAVPGGRKARVVAGVTALLSSKYQDAIVITGDGTIKLHAIRLSVADGGRGKRSVAGELISQLAVPMLDDATDTVVGLDGLSTRGQWFADTAAQSFKPGQLQPQQPLSFAEIETSTPHHPFHAARNVSMHVYADDTKVASDDISDDWVFGDDIETEPLATEEQQYPIQHQHLHQPPPMSPAAAGDGTTTDAGDLSPLPSSNYEATFAFDDEPSPGAERSPMTTFAKRKDEQQQQQQQRRGAGNAAGGTVGGGRRGAAKKTASSQQPPPSMDTYDDLISIQHDIEAAGRSSELGSVHDRRGRAVSYDHSHDDDHHDDEALMRFGEDSDIAY